MLASKNYINIDSASTGFWGSTEFGAVRKFKPSSLIWLIRAISTLLSSSKELSKMFLTHRSLIWRSSHYLEYLTWYSLSARAKSDKTWCKNMKNLQVIIHWAHVTFQIQSIVVVNVISYLASYPSSPALDVTKTEIIEIQLPLQCQCLGMSVN